MILIKPLKVLHDGWQLSDNMRSWQIKAKSPVHGARKSFDNSLFVGFTKARLQIHFCIMKIAKLSSYSEL